MSENKHTPGPWKYQENSDVYTHIVRHGDDRFLCNLGQDTSGRAEADARLIAAAPEMLEALKRAQTFIGNGIELGYIKMPDIESDPANETPKIIAAAIKKAAE